MYLYFIQLIRIPLPWLHEGELGRKKHILLVALDQGHVPLVEDNVVFLLVIVIASHRYLFSSLLLDDLKFVSLCIEIRDACACIDWSLCKIVSCLIR